MEILAHLPDVAQTVTILLTIILGLIIGVIVGVLPGMGPLLGVIMAIPFTYYMDPIASVALLMGIYQGGNFGGAVTAIVLGIPGTPMSAATLLDGHPMARSGRVSDALLLATFGSFAGGTIGAILLILFAPLLANFARGFGPMEIFLLATLGLTAVSTLSGRSPLRGFIAALFGLSIATIGSDPLAGIQRINFDLTQLEGGFNFVAVLMGVFTVSELLMQFVQPNETLGRKVRIELHLALIWRSLRRFGNLLRSSAIGILVGTVPGIGGDTSAYLAYKFARDFSDNPEKFGDGAEEGVIAAESANSSTTGGALIPLLAVGIPGDPVVAALMGGFLIHGLQPGPYLFLNQPEIVYGMLTAFLIGAILLFPVALAMLSALVRLLRVPHSYMIAAVAVTSTIGVYLTQQYMLDLWQFLAFGVVGFVLRLAGIPFAPFVIGYILGPIFEVQLRRTSIITGDDPIGFFLTRPASIVIAILIVFIAITPLLARKRRNREPAE